MGDLVDDYPAAESRSWCGPSVRSVGGTLVDEVFAESDHARVELLRRSSDGRISWRFQQETPTIFWYRSGVREMRVDVNGTAFHVRMMQSNRLCFFPAGTRLEGVFTVDPVAEYAAAFLSPKFVARYGAAVSDRPLVGMAHGRIQLGLLELSRAARRPDGAHEALVEGWALQTLAHLSGLGEPVASEAGLSGEDLARVDQHVRGHLNEKLTVDQLADVAGFSRRHFLRAFKQQTGQTPMRYVYARRLEEAQARLAQREESITDIAVSCGFSHAQHLATAFRRTMGMTPSQFRQQS